MERSFFGPATDHGRGVAAARIWRGAALRLAFAALLVAASTALSLTALVQRAAPSTAASAPRPLATQPAAPASVAVAVDAGHAPRAAVDDAAPRTDI